jgi:4-carboxymuconolactone decarboxylase
MTDSKFPPDVHEESGFRVPLPKREELDDDGKEIFDHFMDPDGGTYVGIKGPGGIRLHSPKLSKLTQEVNYYLRHESGISKRVRELAILATARELNHQFEWVAHEPAALKVGISQEIVDIIKYRKPVDKLDETDAVVIEFGRQLMGARRVEPETFAAAQRLFGTRMLVDIVSVIGSYAATGALLTAFDIQLHPGKEPLLPLD